MPPTSNKDTQTIIEKNVEANALNLTLSALSAALGDIRVMKLEVTNKNSLKYVPVKDEAEIVKALEWIAIYGNNNIYPQDSEDPYLSYFILQQASTNMSAWNALIDRNLGKVPNESKIKLDATFDLAAIGERAIAARKNTITQAVPSMLVPDSWTTAEEDEE